MSEKIGRSTCVVCHAVKERTEMAQHQNYEETGTSSGVSFSTNPSRRNSTRFGSSQRTYKRKKTVWICNGCWAERPIWLTTFLKTLVLSPIYPLAYGGSSKFGVVVGSLIYVVLGIGWSFGLFISCGYTSFPNEIYSYLVMIFLGPACWTTWTPQNDGLRLLIIIPIAITLFLGWVVPIAIAFVGKLRNKQGLPNSRLF